MPCAAQTCGAPAPSNYSISFTEENLRQEISTYGKVIGLEQRGDRIEALVRIQNIEKLPRACDAFSRFASVHAGGNDLRFRAGYRQIRIRDYI